MIYLSFSQDNAAILSYERGIAAHESGAFKWEMVPVEVPGGKGKPSIVIDKDESLDKVIIQITYSLNHSCYSNIVVFVILFSLHMNNCFYHISSCKFVKLGRYYTN